jgi:anti-anti-sigma factor
MRASLRKDGDTAVIRLKGRFDFAGHREFKRCCEGALSEPSVQQIDVDLRGVEYLDSSALGMLLLLRERADSRNVPIALLHCSGIVREILDVASFDTMFTMR